MFSFSDWFPYDLNLDTFLIFVFTMLLTFAGAGAGIIMKMYEGLALLPESNGNSSKLKFWTDDNKLLLMLSFFCGIAFWAVGTEWILNFVYGFLINTTGGTILTWVFRKKLAMTMTATLQGVARKVNAEQEARATVTPVATEVVTDTHPAPARR